MGAKMHIPELKKQPNFKKLTLLKFYKETCDFLAAITSHVIEKPPYNFPVENCTLKFLKLVEKLVYLRRITSKVGDDAKE